MTSKSIDWSREIQTRDGRPARVLATDLKGKYPVVVVLTNSKGEECVDRLTADGRAFGFEPEPCVINIPEPPEKVVRWARLYRDEGVGTWTSITKSPDSTCNPYCIARRRVEFVVGEFEE